MQAYLEFANRIRRDQAVDTSLAELLLSSIHRLTPAQIGALAAFCERRPGQIAQLGAITAGVSSEPRLRRLFSNLTSDERKIASGDELIRRGLECASWHYFVQGVVDRSLNDVELGYFLAAITLDGLSDEAEIALTMEMASSGLSFDYRPDFPNDYLVRRYPTGALSEKVALIMPVVLSGLRFRHKLPLLSPFIVAKALGHTGGTWDKLASVPSFTFPPSGSETLRVLQKCGVCYTVTQGDLNPADRRLYVLRDETDTIESTPLIVSSIASKMLACPVHLMQLDVRYGTGAFFSTRTQADDVGRRISRTITDKGMHCFHTLTEAAQPTGSSIGPAIEVIEAIEALGAPSSGRFEARGILQQRLIVADFTARLATDAVGGDHNALFKTILNEFREGTYVEDFIRVLAAHGVDQEIAADLWKGSWSLLERYRRIRVPASKTGRLVKIDQMRLGRLVNGSPSNTNVNLKTMLFDEVSKGEILFDVFATDSNLDLAGLERAFEID